MVESARQERIYAPHRIDDWEKAKTVYGPGDLMTYEDALKYGVITDEQVQAEDDEKAAEAERAKRKRADRAKRKAADRSKKPAQDR
jgi:hypothetical protein